MSKYIDVSALNGLTVTNIYGMSENSESVTFQTAEGRTFRMYHSQDCCESVALVDVAGNVDDLIGSPILQAEQVDGPNEKPSEYAESWTWTFYKFATIKGYVTLRWLGESNGYYSESVDFQETT